MPLNGRKVGRVVAFLALAVMPTVTLAAATNVTVDDVDLGIFYSYTPNQLNWAANPGCPLCAAQPPNRDLIYNQTWHDSTMLAGAAPNFFEYAFNGTAIYVYGIYVDAVAPNWITAVDVYFFVDGHSVGSYTHTPLNTGDYHYQVPLLALQGLDDTSHTLRGELAANSNILLDYIVYTKGSNDSGSSPLSSTRDLAPSGLSTGAIAGIVIGVVGTLAIMVVLAFLLGRRSRKRDYNGPRPISASTVGINNEASTLANAGSMVELSYPMTTPYPSTQNLTSHGFTDSQTNSKQRRRLEEATMPPVQRPLALHEGLPSWMAASSSGGSRRGRRPEDERLPSHSGFSSYLGPGESLDSRSGISAGDSFLRTPSTLTGPDPRRTLPPPYEQPPLLTPLLPDQKSGDQLVGLHQRLTWDLRIPWTTAMYTPVDADLSAAFSKQILVLPTVSKGNVGQLACDLLIASLSLKRIGILDASMLIPVVGGREDRAKGLSTPLEVFSKNGSNVVVVQQRSPVLKMHKEAFVESLLKWIESSKFAAVVLLAGMDTTNRSDAQMHTPTYTFIPPGSPPLPSALSNSLSAVETYAPVTTVLHSASTREDAGIPLIPGGGLTRRMFTSLSEKKSSSGSWKIPMVAILHFVFEGDNRGDAGRLVALINQALDLRLERVVEPESWRRGLFGSAHDGSLFG